MRTMTPHPPVAERWLRVEQSIAVIQIRGGAAHTWLYLGGTAFCHGKMLATPTR